MKKKLVLFDLDGTIVSYRGRTHVPQETREALCRLRENGHLIAFATSRDRLTAASLMAELEVSAAVLNNGAIAFSGGAAIFEKRIGKKESTQLRERLLQTPFVVFAYDGGFLYEHNATEESKRYLSQIVGGRDRLRPLSTCDGALLSLNVYDKAGGSPDIRKLPEGVIYEAAQHEIRACGTSKNDGMVRLADFFRIKQRDLVAVGDGCNDIGMIRSAGVGAAVGNACAELKKAADVVFDDIDRGGIKKGLEDLKLI